MFGKNEIVGIKFFKNVETRKLLVTSRFYTLQGEGPKAGRPAVFVRLAKCQLACSFCDTFFDQGSWMTVDEILQDATESIKKFHDGAHYNLKEYIKQSVGLVVTGGEPTLQANLRSLLESASEVFAWTQIESNGIIDATPLVTPETIVVISPKCNEVDGIAQKYLKPNKNNLTRANAFKFVVESPANNTSPYNSVPDWALQQKSVPVYVSPMNKYLDLPQKAKDLRSKDVTIDIDTRSTVDEVISFWEPGLLDMPANQRNHEYAALYAMQHGLILNLQTHLYASLP